MLDTTPVPGLAKLYQEFFLKCVFQDSGEVVVT